MVNSVAHRAEQERLRLRALDDFPFLEAGPESDFDALLHLALGYVGAPLALLSLVDDARPWVKSSIGLDPATEQAIMALCPASALPPEGLLLCDATTDSRYAQHPLVAGAPGLRFIAAMPLRTSDGQAVGALWVLDTQAHPGFGAEPARALASLARQAMVQMELRRDHERLRRSQRELENTKAQLELVLKGTNDGWWDRDLRTGVIQFSDRTLEMLGYRPQDLPAEDDISGLLFAPADLRYINSVIRAAVRSGDIRFRAELSMLRQDGSLLPVVCRGYISRDHSGWATRISGMMTDLSAFKRSQKARQESQERYRQLFEHSMDGVMLSRVSDGRLFSINPAACAMLGRSETSLLAVGRAGFVDGSDPRVQALLAQRARDGFVRGEMRLLRADGAPFEVEVSSVEYRNADGEAMASTVFRDITERKQAESELRIAACAFESQEGIIVCNADWAILRVNRSFAKITGYSAEESLGRTPQQLMGPSLAEAVLYSGMAKSLRDQGTWQGEVWTLRKDASLCPVWLIVTVLRDASGALTHYVATLTEITDRKKAEEEIRNLAFYDALTGLPNRRLLFDRLGQALNNSPRRKRHGALLFLDLDNFKVLNDTLGHAMGDQLLKQVAQRLVACVREGDTVARLGGDEFVVMLLDLSPDAYAAATQAEQVGEKIVEALNQPYPMGTTTHVSTPSIGVTLFGAERESVEELLKRADLAMYEAKAAGRNTLRFFDASMQLAISRRVALEADLREALLQHQFLLHYQAQVDAYGQLTGAEVLVRWRHPTRGLVMPGQFIAVAEEMGAIQALGRWVLETACRQIAVWSGDPLARHLTVAVNISGRQLMRSDFVDMVLQVLQETGAPAQRLKLELTESVLVSDVENTIAKMRVLQTMGVRFSMDDFGTGYSSLSFLKRLPLDQLKIDQGFVRDILMDPNDAAIAKMVIALADSLGLGVIAEGVETEAQKVFLDALGCDAYQGYLFGKPMQLPDFEARYLAPLGAT